MFENASRTEVSLLGEFGLIDHLSQNFTSKQASTLKGIGDDAAVLEKDAENVTLVSTDLLIEGVHFDLHYMPLKHLGYKAVTVNLSDIYAMNGIPEQITVSLAFSNRFSLEAIEELYSGIKHACDFYGIDLVGGDTSSSHSGLMLSVTAIGTCRKDAVVYRSGAQEHDLICVTGDLGAAYLGLQLLEREKKIFLENPGAQPDLEGFDYILERQLKPEARRDMIQFLHDKKLKPTAMMDISDGLSSELHHIAKQSNVGITIYEDKLPIDAIVYNNAQELGLESTTCALNGGEDYELLFTVPQSMFEQIKGVEGISIIGHCNMAGTGIHLISKAGTQYPLPAQGWTNM
ncbi:MAG: thiamine-phosphate kinase [Bacteroidota bacterium]|nr:thiamine-phosphate kinase [Bacteroidota bacterium]